MTTKHGYKLEEWETDVMKTWPCADFSFIRDLLRILSWCT